ncbi:MAG: zinc ribbon-containing protein [Gammaproteobacteria bacterium]|nr:zinc ribbon-containing protein [Gammaproteobacteria bacterium]
MTEQHPSPAERAAERLAAAYNRMMERIRELMEDAEDKGIPTLEEGIRRAADKAVELGEVTREEAEKIGGWIRRDMEEATHYLADGGREFADWLKFDIGQVEERLLDVLFSVADRTRLELAAFERAMEANNVYRTGEITGAGVLECMDCGEPMHFYETSTIPACPKCGGTKFRRPRG